MVETVCFDIQVNGYAGLDFNADDWELDDLHRIIDRLTSDGVPKILPTIITDEIDTMVRRIGRIATAIEGNPRVADAFAGIHVEGPFLSAVEGYRGAHPLASIRAACLESAKRLVDAGQGHVRLFTLAPEQDADGCVTRLLADRGICIAAGHTDASLDTLNRSLDAGLRLFTHLGNGCPAMLPRHDNIIQRVLSLADRLHISLIADGHHLPPFVLRNFLAIIPRERVILVTDAVAAAGMGPGTHFVLGQEVFVDEQGACWSADRTHFAGSAATMPEMRRVLREIFELGDDRHVDFDWWRQWTDRNPHAVLEASS
ncbi:MAG: N-acetylglucosamine-6-phosphate deacetylase [Planctomycetota bacterium]